MLLTICIAIGTLISLLHEQTLLTRAFCTNIRSYNNALSFTSLGVRLDESFTQGGMSTHFGSKVLYIVV